MRMWMISPECLCRKHLLGEHNEIHKHRHNFEKKHSIKGRLYPIVQIEPYSMSIRHDELAEEMLKRGYDHKSPYTQPSLDHLPIEQKFAVVDTNISIKDLSNRCSDCKLLIERK